VTGEPVEHQALERATMRRVILRLVPFLMVCYFFALLDRVNVGFAALQMNKDLGLTPAMFGFAASLFFVSYFLVEVPSNLALQKVGARRWISRIMVTWGMVTACMAFIMTSHACTGVEVSFFMEVTKISGKLGNPYHNYTTVKYIDTNTIDFNIAD